MKIRLTKITKITFLAFGLMFLLLLGLWPTNAIKEAGIKKRKEYSTAKILEKTDSQYMEYIKGDFDAFSWCSVIGETVKMNGFTEATNVSKITYTHEYEYWKKFTDSETKEVPDGKDANGNPKTKQKTDYFDNWKWDWQITETKEIKAKWYTLNGMKTKVGSGELKKYSGNYVYKGIQPWSDYSDWHKSNAYTNTKGRTRYHYNWTANEASFFGYIKIRNGIVTELKVGHGFESAKEMKNKWVKPGIGHIIFFIFWCIVFTGLWVWLLWWSFVTTDWLKEPGRRYKNNWFWYFDYRNTEFEKENW